jgi:predicted ATPase/Tfp pilus assembly protein PilF/DNA-binding XRE family transcriptional regulator
MTTEQFPTFGATLRRYRTAAGWTQEELAERAGVSVRSISNLERGAPYIPRPETVRLLADALGFAQHEQAHWIAATRETDGLPARPPLTLPAPPTPLIGREQEVARACTLLRQEEVRLLTLSGPAGVGKTRLGLAVAAAVHSEFADGVFLVTLAPIDDASLVAPTIAQALGLREQGDRPLGETLAEHLRVRQLLLLLDNFEHVAGAAPQLAELLATCPRLTLLVTSRAAVRIRGEHVLPVPPLTLPDATTFPPLDGLARVPAVALFLQRARAARPDFALTPENAQVVAAICRRLDGLPLALELAAARISLLPPHEILARLERRLLLLTGGPHDLPARQQTLRNALAWSYDILPASEQALFRRLSVFAGGCTLAAAEAIAAATGHLSLDVVEGLASLVDQSLLWRQEGIGGESRIGMLETMREYAHEWLEASGEQATAERAHAAYYLAFAERAEPELVGPEQVIWLQRLEAEHDNLRAALHWAHEQRESDAGSLNAIREGDGRVHEVLQPGELGLRLAGVLWRFWDARGYLSEGRACLEGFLACSDSRAIPASVRAKALHGAAVLAHKQGDTERATMLYERSLVLQRQLGNVAAVAAILNGLGNLAHLHGDQEQAVALYTESLTLRRAMADQPGTAAVLNNLGLLAQHWGDYESAAAFHGESLALARQMGNKQHSATALLNLGDVAHYQGDDDKAAALYRDSIALFREIGFKQGLASALLGLGTIAQARCDEEQAAACYGESLALSRDLGDKEAIAYGLEGLAAVALGCGRLRRATRLFGAAAALRTAIAVPLPPAERAGYDSAVAALQRALGDDNFTTAWAAGAALPLEHAIAEALEPLRVARP